MTTQNFLNLMAKNPQKELVFEYEPNQFVPAAYHISEIKNVQFSAVDCGGNVHEEFQTVAQLWINSKDFLKRKGIATEKALKIFNIVDGVKPLRKDTELFFEYGYKDLRTSNYSIEEIVENDAQLIVKLFVEKTACRPVKETIEKGKKLFNLSCC